MIDPISLHARIDARFAGAVEELSAYVAQPSVAATGEGIERCAGLVQALLRRRGFDADVRSTGGHPVVTGRGGNAQSGRRLLFYNHYDVQPVDPVDDWSTPPFSPTIRDGLLFGRGAKDDKGELIARLLGLDALRELSGELPCEVAFLVEGEEEIGSPNLAAFVADGHLPCHAVIGEGASTDVEGHPLLNLGHRGTLYVELSLQGLASDAHSLYANVLPSPAWRLTWALGSLKRDDETVLIPGFYDSVRSPTPIEREFAAAIVDDREAVRRHFGAERLIDSATDAGLLFFEPTCNIDGLTAGYQGPGLKTIVPSRASAKVDFRLVPDQEPRDILTKLRTHLDRLGFEDIELSVLEADPPGQTAADSPLVEVWRETAERVYNRSPRVLPLSGGTGPNFLWTSRGIPVVSVGVGYHGDSGNRIHAPDEHVRLKDVASGALHTALLVDAFARLS
jgi:acetylornithine deacetylase/succinyl-diaminopimelate desuccinylase-like protein